MSKDKTVFAHPEYIEPQAEKIFESLEKENFLNGLSRELFFKRLSYYYSEFNIIHPFREGNGRTHKILINEILRRLNYQVDWKKISVDQYFFAVKNAYFGFIAA